MIQESSYWKDPLLEMALRLRAFTTCSSLTDGQFAQIERDVFIGFYSVRKLLEAHEKITDKTRATKIRLDHYANLNPVTHHNSHRLDQLYELEDPNQETRDIFFICHRIIHSFIFTPSFDEKGFAGILFTSDIDKDKKLYSLSAERLIAIFELVGNDYPQRVAWTRDEAGNETRTID